jgi:hypothetical protein
MKEPNIISYDEAMTNTDNKEEWKKGNGTRDSIVGGSWHLGTSTNLRCKHKDPTFDIGTTLQTISRWQDQEAQGAHLHVRWLAGRRLCYLCPCHLLDICAYLFGIVNHLPLDDMQYWLLECICSSHVKRTCLDSSASRFPVKRSKHLLTDETFHLWFNICLKVSCQKEQTPAYRWNVPSMV